MNRCVSIVVVLVPLLAVAGKPEREKQKEVTAQCGEQEKATKAACGCEVKMSVKWDTYKTADDMFRIHNACEAFSAAAKQYCSSADDKKAFCANVSTLEISYSADPGNPERKGKVVTAHSRDNLAPGETNFSQLFQEF